MGEVLHAGALAPAAVGVCCVAAGRGRARAPELAAALLMLVAMLDAMVWQHLAPVLWSALLILAAVTLGAVRGRMARGRAAARGERTAPPTTMAVHTALGLVVMAGLVAMMSVTADGAVGPAAAAGHHGGASGSLAVIMSVAAILYGLGSVAAAVGARVHATRLERAELVAMGLSAGAMGIALLL